MSRGSYVECTGQDAGQRCTSQSHQVLREGLPPAIPEGVHKYFVVLDGDGADSGIQVEGSPAPCITLKVSKAALEQSSSAGRHCGLRPCKAALQSTQIFTGMPLRQITAASLTQLEWHCALHLYKLALLTDQQSSTAPRTGTKAAH